jgi:hypothetical protein
MPDDQDKAADNVLAIISRWVVVVLFFLFVAGVTWSFGYGGVNPDVFRIVVLENFAASVGLPAAAAAALFIVLVLKVTSGPIEFEGLGFRFKGASGPIVLWVMCFLSMVFGIKALWNQ